MIWNYLLTHKQVKLKSQKWFWNFWRLNKNPWTLEKKTSPPSIAEAGSWHTSFPSMNRLFFWRIICRKSHQVKATTFATYHILYTVTMNSMVGRWFQFDKQIVIFVFYTSPKNTWFPETYLVGTEWFIHPSIHSLIGFRIPIIPWPQSQWYVIQIQLIWPNGIIFHQPIDFPEIFGEFPYNSPPFGGPIGRVRSRANLTRTNQFNLLGLKDFYMKQKHVTPWEGYFTKHFMYLKWRNPHLSKLYG